MILEGGMSPTVAARRGAFIAILVVLLTGSALPGLESAAGAPTIVHRVNAGGTSLTGSPAWSGDTSAAPSQYVNAAATGNTTFSTTSAIDLSHPSIPAGTPAALFQTERWDAAAAPELEWNFPVTAGSYLVRLYLAEIYSGTQSVGARVFDVSIEGKLVLDNYDIFAEVGANKGVVKSFTVASDANLDLDFGHVVENPALKAIEIVTSGPSPNQLGATPAAADFGAVAVNQTQTKQIQLLNLGGSGAPAIVVDQTSITGTGAAHFTDSFNDAGNVTLAPGASTTVTVSFKPTTAGAKSATLNVVHSGANSPLAVPLSGSGGASTPVGFGKSLLAGASSQQATSLQVGPDGRLYVAQQNGFIKAYSVVRNGANSYAVTATETISAVRSIMNHNDDGSLNLAVNDRIITGILLVGTAANPVIYATSSDPRIGGGSSGSDLGLDTNSSTVSRLTWTGSSWQKVDLVRGLPRSEENHSANGLQLDKTTNTLYVAQGGNTNMGAKSNNFALLPEYALSGAILSVNLTAIGNTTYDLPTLDDDSRGGSVDFNDPFGGNDGKNQAKVVPGGPVKVYAPGFRNPYDLVITQAGRMYTIDNGGNAGWGGMPVNEGPAGTCTNGVSEPGTTQADTLHLITAAGYYGGHPNPTRANKANTFNANGQSPVSSGNAVECDFRFPGLEQGSLATFPTSTNGLAEYTASNFGSAMKGDLVTASFNNSVYRIDLNSTGTSANTSTLFSSVGSTPLDVVAQGDAGPFPGTIWVADIANGSITVFEPNDFATGPPPCSGVNSPTLDEDGDGFKNADEIANGTNPCSAGDVPPDWDGDKVSNLKDPDDDNDSKPDTSDPFAIDASNGTTKALPVRLTWNNDAPPAGGLLNLGFTGLMTNGTANYESLFDPANMTAGGAAGVTTVDKVPDGDALAGANSQQYGFQFGVKVPQTGTFTAHTRIMSPFAGLSPQNFQSMGLYLGTGGQNDYAKVVVSANGGAGGIQFLKEVAGVPTSRPQAAVALPGPSTIDLYLTVDPAAKTVQPSYAVGSGARVNLGGPEPIPAGWLASTTALAVGIISTSAGPAPEFPATWDLIEVEVGGPTDTTPPTVTQTAPPAGVTGAAAAANVEATFSEAMSASSITATTFTLQKQGAAGPLAAAVTYDTATKKAILNPSADLEAGATYTATIKGGAGGVKDAAGNALAADKVWSFTVAAAAPPPAQQGLMGEYFNNQNLTALVLTRTDPTVNFDWGTGSPHASIAPDTFSARWTGEVKADHSQQYTFSTLSDDGVRLWVGATLVINNWTDHPPTENAGTIALQAGQWYPITLEYYESGGIAAMSLSYASASTPKQIVPADHLRPPGAGP
jgi:PA14 domain/Bacterial Ig-like domain/Malectin domain/Abnormal spindle-like microcephaly-assoc'd, ASPM-SPD-2-Hydin/Glucose / Sorbosone dehydrogenase